MPPDPQAQWPHPDNAPAPPRAIARAGGELVAVVRVALWTFDGTTKLWEVTGRDVTDHFRVIWQTRVAPMVGEHYWIWRTGPGEVYAVSEAGDRHQVQEMASSNTPFSRADDRPFDDPDPELVADAERAAAALNVQLEFRPSERPTSAVLITGRGEIVQGYFVDWPSTLDKLGLELDQDKWPPLPF
jgi:hypothetical protein